VDNERFVICKNVEDGCEQRIAAKRRGNTFVCCCPVIDHGRGSLVVAVVNGGSGVVEDWTWPFLSGHQLVCISYPQLSKNMTRILL